MTCKGERLKIAIRFAKRSGFNGASYLMEWSGYSVFMPLFEDNEIHYIGQPIFILVKDAHPARTAIKYEWNEFTTLMPDV